MLKGSVVNSHRPFAKKASWKTGEADKDNLYHKKVPEQRPLTSNSHR